MSNSSMPPRGPSENVYVLPSKANASNDDTEPKRRRTDTNEAIGNVVSLRKEEIRMRRERKSRVRNRGPELHKAEPKVDGLTIPKGPTVKSIAGGKITEEKVAALEDRDRVVERRGQKQLYLTALSMDLEEIESDPLAAVDELLAMRDQVAQSEDLSEFFHPVAAILLRIWPQNYGRYLNDKRVQNLVTALKDYPTKRKLIAILQNYNRDVART